jgi:hypothetical protein
MGLSLLVQDTFPVIVILLEFSYPPAKQGTSGLTGVSSTSLGMTTDKSI